MTRIMVVDDDAVIRNAVSTYLKYCGYDVLTAADGLEGVQLFRSCPDLIDVVVTDLQMPRMTGNEAALQIWATRPDMNMICMAAYAEAACPFGVTMLQKPFRLEALRVAVRKALNPTVGSY
jgi:CheY-like chemotaxis protein